MSHAIESQEQYYKETAAQYDELHLGEIDEHFVALSWLASLIRLHKLESLLDVGAGTGRCLNYLKAEGLPIELKGVEPVRALRDIGISKGLSKSELTHGDALALPFDDHSIDVVCSFGVLHHIEDHCRAVSEMCRVARRAVFISDSNNFGQGGPSARLLKQGMHALGLWKVFDLIRTKGRRYHQSEEDGIFYSYSIVEDLPLLRSRFPSLRFLGTGPSDTNLYRTSSHIAVFASGR